MGLFSKLAQRITISTEWRDVVEAMIAALKSQKLNGVKISSLTQAEGEWRFTIHAKSAEQIYQEEILPLLQSSGRPDVLQVLLEFEDEVKATKSCPQEILMSIELGSGRPLGDKAENEFIQKLHHELRQSPRGVLAAVAYYIVSDNVVTICVPAADVQVIEEYLKDKINTFGIKRSQLKIVDRGRA